jgi:hypothetical protein
MNHISQRNRLEARLKSYMDFTPYCPRDSFLKLSNEMVKITERLDKIKCMSLDELMKPIDFQFETKQSRVNFIDHTPTIPSTIDPKKIYKTK